ncbi:MAG: DegT/DnrJ/EryC1/StrS family aminotransferase [Acidobacteriaceae bacterium]|nr:DegT/DnrJ/EryC1/StrS family aminotransferase [Acidobacteriaceae bacterium]
MSAIVPEIVSCSQGSRYNYHHQFGDIQPLVDDLRRMLLEGHYVLSAEVQEFESAFARYCGCRHARGVNSGTDALVIAMRALGIGRGDSVVTQANTFHATVAAIELAGAKPVLVDAKDETFSFDVDQLASRAGGDIRAVIPVHLFGKPAPLRQILDIAGAHGMLVIEDAAQAHGASISGQRVGSFGTAGCFSFHPSKNLGAAGDAGAIVTNDSVFADRIEQYRSLGQREQNEHLVVGLNSKLDALQARILGWKLPQLDRWNRARRTVAGWYRSALAGVPVSFQAEAKDEVHVYHLFQIRTACRDQLLKFLRGKGIDAVVRYPTPIHLQPAFQKWGWREGEFPVAESLARELLCLPIRPDMDEGEVDFISSKVRAFFDERFRQQNGV